MSTWTVRLLHGVLALALAGSLFVQVVMVPLLAADLADARGDVADVRHLLVALVVLGIVAVQVSLVCVWRLATMVRVGTVFSTRAFRYVDVVAGAMAAAAVVVLAFGAALAPGDAVAPGVVLLIGGVGVLVAGVALVVVVLRLLLAQAVARDTEARDLRAELDEVI